MIKNFVHLLAVHTEGTVARLFTSEKLKGFRREEIVIGVNAVSPGVSIGDEVMVGTGSVVTEDYRVQ